MRIRARAVMVRTGSGPVDYIADRVQVIGVSLSSSGDDVDRSETLDPMAPPRASVVLGRRIASVTIEQEVYGDLSQHAALFRACPVEVTQSSAGIAGSVSSSPSARGKRCTIEIVEVGGNRYRITDALGVFTMSGAPGERLLLTFDLQGELVPVEDAGLAPMAFVMPPAPLVYRNASLLASEQAFATCPEFSFDPGMTLGSMDYTCSPDGGRASFVQRDAQAVLALTGVLSGRESIDGHWAAARVPVCGATLDATVWSDGVSSSVRVELRECATVDPELAEVESFAAYDLAVGAGTWSLVWAMDEGVPLIINPVGEDIGGIMYVFTEGVHVSGSATPDSTITVNGQPVVVGGDGSWSVELTLPAGQSHIITAQGDDGKVAQVSVYVWGEPDILAYGPEVLLMRYTGQYTDSAMTIPAIEADPAGAWMDQSGNGNHFTQPVSAHRPIIQDGGVFTERTSTWLESLHTALTPFTAFIATGPASGAGTLYGGTGGDRGSAGTWMFSAQTNARRLHMPQGSNNYSEAADVNLEYSNPASIAGIAQPDREFWVEGLGVVGTTTNKIVSDDWATNKPTRIQSRAGEISTRYFMFFSEILPYDDRQMILRWLEANND